MFMFMSNTHPRVNPGVASQEACAAFQVFADVLLWTTMMVLLFPAAQFEQGLKFAAVVVLNCPPAHRVQDSIPCVRLYVPAPHWGQDDPDV